MDDQQAAPEPMFRRVNLEEKEDGFLRVRSGDDAYEPMTEEERRLIFGNHTPVVERDAEGGHKLMAQFLLPEEEKEGYTDVFMIWGGQGLQEDFVLSELPSATSGGGDGEESDNEMNLERLGGLAPFIISSWYNSISWFFCQTSQVFR